MELILATWNPQKIQWLKHGFSALRLGIRGAGELGIADIEETGTSCTENAMLKVSTIGAKPNSIIIGEDSGLFVEALDGFPGTKTARWSSGTDDDRSTKLLELMQNLTLNERKASFKSTIVLLFPDSSTQYCSGEISGHIAMKNEGNPGGGYQNIFVQRNGQVMAASNSDFIQAGDHRDQAMKMASLKIQNWVENHA